MYIYIKEYTLTRPNINNNNNNDLTNEQQVIPTPFQFWNFLGGKKQEPFRKLEVVQREVVKDV